MLEGKGEEQEGKCGGESYDGGRNWKETERMPQEEMEIPLLRHSDVNYMDSLAVQCLVILKFTST